MIQSPQEFRVEEVVRVESKHSFDLFRREICPSVELNLYGNLRPLRFCEANLGFGLMPYIVAYHNQEKR